MTHDSLLEHRRGDHHPQVIPLHEGNRRTTQERKTISVVIPTLNEELNIVWVLERLPDCVDEVVIVDGYSVDGTVEAVLRARPDALVVQQVGRGKGAALRTAFAACTGDYVVCIDSDCSMDPEEIPRYIDALDKGYEFVKGSRFLPGGSSHDLTLLRSCGNRTLTASVNVLFGVPLTDLCYGFFAFQRRVLDELALHARGFEIETEIAVRAIKLRLRIAEVPSIEHARMHGESNLRTFRDGGRVLRKILRERIVQRSGIVVDHIQLPVVHPSHRMPTLSDRAQATATALGEAQ